MGPIEEHDPAPRAILDELRSDVRVHLTGNVDDTVPIYAAIDVLAFPTYREGLPNVLLEASAMRVAIVASRVPGCTDVIQDGVTGSLVPMQDSAALADSIRWYRTTGNYGKHMDRQPVNAFCAIFVRRISGTRLLANTRGSS